MKTWSLRYDTVMADDNGNGAVRMLLANLIYIILMQVGYVAKELTAASNDHLSRDFIRSKHTFI